MKFKELYESELITESPNFDTSDTGLPYQIYVSQKPQVEHNLPRLKININGTLFPISFGKDIKWLTPTSMTPKIKSKELKLIKQFIGKNNKMLLQFWYKEIDEQHLRQNIKKV